MCQRLTIISQSLLVLGKIITAHLLFPAFAWAPFDNCFPSRSDWILAMDLVPWDLIGFSLENEIWPWGKLFPTQRGAQARSVTRPASVQFSCSVVSSSLWPPGLQHARLPCPSPTLRICSNSCPLSWWCHPTISSSVLNLAICKSPSHIIWGREFKPGPAL